MNMLITIFRTLFFYFFVTLIYRIMGKREVGELGIIDLIVSILIATTMVPIYYSNNLYTQIVGIILSIIYFVYYNKNSAKALTKIVKKR